MAGVVIYRLAREKQGQREGRPVGLWVGSPSWRFRTPRLLHKDSVPRTWYLQGSITAFLEKKATLHCL